MSTPAHIDSETISQTDRARRSQVPILLPDDPYIAVRQAYLATITDTESEPFKDSSKTEIPQPLPIASSPVPPSNDHYLIVGQAYTPAAIDTESKPEESPSKTEEFQPLAIRTAPLSSDHTLTSSDLTPVSPLTDKEFEASELTDTRITPSHSTAPSDSTTLLFPDHPLTQTSPTPTRVSYYRSTARMARYRSYYETPSPSSSLTHPIRKRYQGTSELIEDIEEESLDLNTEENSLEDKGSGSEEEEDVPEGQQQAVSVMDTTANEPLGLGYGALRRCMCRASEGRGDSCTPVRATWVDIVDGTVYTDILIYVPPVRVPVQTPPSPEWSSGSLPVSPSSLAVPILVASPSTTPTVTIAVDEDEFLKGYDRDFRDLYTRSREVRDEIFSQHYKFMSLKQEQERVTMTFGALCRPMLALKSWAGHNTTMQRELQELKDRVTTLEREGSRKE
nr:hypothetical protein [Tanacetum cinerariifolium]